MAFAEDAGDAFDVRGLGDLQTRLRAMSYLEVRVAVLVSVCHLCG